MFKKNTLERILLRSVDYEYSKLRSKMTSGHKSAGTDTEKGLNIK